MPSAKCRFGTLDFFSLNSGLGFDILFRVFSALQDDWHIDPNDFIPFLFKQKIVNLCGSGQGFHVFIYFGHFNHN